MNSLHDAHEAQGTPILLLLLRLPEFAEVAWRDGRRAAQRLERMTVRAFAAAADRIMRDGDILGHDPGSDWFAVAMLSPARTGTSFGPLDARAALERIAATTAVETGRRLEAGWWPIETRSEIDAFETTRERALERGARERERFEFFATVGHELRTPLTSIRGYIETLLDGNVDPETSRRFLETARRQALRLARLVDGMLDFSMLDLSLSLSRGVSELDAVIRCALDVLAPVAADANVALRQRSALCAHVRIDADSCMHALLNVMENAIKYSRAGGIVEIFVSREDPFVFVSVEDNGAGIAAGDRERIFSYGERAGESEAVHGKGLGLAIVRTIVERAGGRIDIGDSQLGGARFTIALPALQAEFVPPSE